jgi:hypothetical protein
LNAADEAMRADDLQRRRDAKAGNSRAKAQREAAIAYGLTVPARGRIPKKIQKSVARLGELVAAIHLLLGNPNAPITADFRQRVGKTLLATDPGGRLDAGAVHDLVEQGTAADWRARAATANVSVPSRGPLNPTARMTILLAEWEGLARLSAAAAV